MTIALTIGAYKMADYVELNLAQCRRLFGDDVIMLVSDDRSPQSEEIADVAIRYDASYVCGEKRCSHFTGDLQTFLRAAKFGELIGADVCLKLSQRFVPAHHDFVDVLLGQFSDTTTSMVLPGQPQKRQLARPSAGFYAGFGLLTDCVAWRPKDLTGEQIEKFYRDQLADVSIQVKWKHMIEITIGRIAASLLNGRVRMLDELANHQIGKPKLYLRKAQSNHGEYVALAREHGITGDFDVREWIAIEGRDYVPMGAVV